MFKELGGIMSMLGNRKELAARVSELRTKRVEGTAGGMVTVEMNGFLKVVSCRIDPQVFEQGDRELLEDLVATATNEAVKKAQELQGEVVGFPNMGEMLSKLGEEIPDGPPT